MDEIEEFRDIPGYEGIYQVSDLGRVKSLKRKGNLNEKILNGTINSIGYLQVSLGKQFKIHQLVAMAFLGHKPNGNMKIIINHKNEIKTDNNVENLELCSVRYNNIYSRKNSTGYTGVSKNCKKYKASIIIDGKNKYLGNFKTPEDASQAYQNAYQNAYKKIEKN